MRIRYLAAAALAAALIAAPGSAQSVAELLQKGIYAQQTAGDLDGAIQIFRQIVSSNPAQRVYAAQAQMHLAQALLQKGDLTGAAQEFTTLSANYSEFRDMISGMAGHMAGVRHERVFSLGNVTLSQGEPDRYVHHLTGVSLTAPAGWKLEGDSESSGGGQMVMFSSSNIQTDILAVWLKQPDGGGTDITGLLRASLERKSQDRTDFAGWKIRPESVQTRVVGGQQALSAIADYTENETNVQSSAIAFDYTANTVTMSLPFKATTNVPVKMVEYLIWARSPKAQVLFFGRAKAGDLQALQSGIDQLAASSVIP